jgi:hypothetical protein
MPTSPPIRLNFVPLSTHAISSLIWRRPLPPNTPKPEGAMCYTLPIAEGADKRATYIIRLTQESGYEAWEFTDIQNRQLALRYIFELLACQTEERRRANCFSIHRGFQRGIAYTVRNTPLGQQQIWLEPYYLSVNKQYGFLIDFHFKKADGVPYNRDVQRLSLSLDDHFRSNKNAYIDREAMINAFLHDDIPQLFPLTHASLAQPINLAIGFASLRTEELSPKLFRLGENGTDSSQWRGLERCGPLEPIAENNVGCIMLYHRDHRALAEDLYRALMGKTSGVAFKGLPAVFRTTINHFHGVTLTSWTPDALREAIQTIAEIKQSQPEENLIVIMIEERENSAFYYNTKYQLLRLQLPLQVVSAQLINRREQFKWSVSNIALQVFTKLGGKPWMVVPAHDNCLIIGIGQAHRLGVQGIQRYFAYCVATDSSGIYKKIVVLSNTNSRSAYLNDLTRSLTKELSEAKPDEYTHCVIHIPFKLKDDELQAFEDAVSAASEAESRIEFTVIKINDQHRFFGYAGNNSRVPIEGTIARLSYNSLLLWFEGLKHANDVISRHIAGPVHVEFIWPKQDVEAAEQRKHLQDLFNLSGANWRGFNARSTPVSTYYCRLIAKFIAEFPEQLPRIEATEHPWFL